jgi:hypothetical protein
VKSTTGSEQSLLHVATQINGSSIQINGYSHFTGQADWTTFPSHRAKSRMAVNVTLDGSGWRPRGDSGVGKCRGLFTTCILCATRRCPPHLYPQHGMVMPGMLSEHVQPSYSTRMYTFLLFLSCIVV